MEIWFTSGTSTEKTVSLPNLIWLAFIESSQYFGQNTAKNKLIGFSLLEKQTMGLGMFRKFSLLKKRLSILLQLQINKKK